MQPFFIVMKFGSHSLSLDTPRVMGILNVTPDSFYDGGTLYSGSELVLDQALFRAEAMCRDGADFIDVGGESTRPGAVQPSSQEELDRVLPVVERLVADFNTVVSVDTSNPDLIREAAKLGAGLVNDVRALERDGALSAAAHAGIPVCLMHMQGDPQSMQSNPNYQDTVAEVDTYFRRRVEACLLAGIDRDQIILDPGIGFGKTDEHNRALIQAGTTFCDHRFPVLIGVSRKSIFGRLLGREVEARLAGSLVMAYEALQRGAKILRVHDVAETVDAIKIFNFMNH
jgi:dihydropteroate synthase